MKVPATTRNPSVNMLLFRVLQNGSSPCSDVYTNNVQPSSTINKELVRWINTHISEV
jgi:hypothetical protein